MAEYQYQEYPRMLYHVSGNKVVYSEEEFNFYLKKGWQKEAIELSEENRIEAKIVWHESEIDQLKEKLDDLRNTEIDDDNTDSNVSVVDSDDEEELLVLPKENVAAKDDEENSTEAVIDNNLNRRRRRK